MPVTTAMRPDTFATTFTRGFAGAIRDAAGRDGRLSATEATKVAAPYRDNAENFLAATGQKSVSVEKLIASGYDYAFANAAKVAGADGKVSLNDATKLPVDLRFEYFRARGKSEPIATADRQAAILAAAHPDMEADLSLVSHVEARDLPPGVKRAIEAAKKQFTADHDDFDDTDVEFHGPYSVHRSATDQTVVGYAIQAQASDLRGGWSSQTTFGFDPSGKRIVEEQSSGP